MGRQSDKTEVGSAKRTRFRRIKVKAAIVLAALVVLTVISMVPSRNRDAPPGEEPPVNVTTMTVTVEPQLADTFYLPAVVEPNEIITVAAEVAGRIEKIPLPKGNIVQAGDLIIQLNDDLVRPQFESAQAQFKRDQIEFERMAALVENDATARRDLDDATSNLAISKANLAEVRARLDRTRILAPTAGVLNDLPVEVGEYVDPGAAVAEVIYKDTVKVVTHVPESDVAFFSVGQPAQVFAEAKGEQQSLTGSITFISELADRRTRSTRMEITVDNTQALLRCGQIVKVRLTRRILENAVMIPLLAVIPMENSKAVYIVNSTQAQRRQVELGLIKGDRILVTGGLEPGDKLIIAGHRFVAPGQKVNVISQTE